MKSGSMVLNEKAAGISLAVVLGGIYVICLFLLWVMPNALLGIGQGMFHGLQLSMYQPAMSAGLFTGLIAWIIVGFLAGFTFAKIYNTINK